MSDGAVGTQDASVVGNLCEVLVQFHAVVHHGAYLQQVELACLVGVQIGCKLNLHGPSHLFLAVLEHFAHQFGEREHTVLEYAGKGDDLAVAPFVVAVVDALVDGVVGAAYPGQCAVLLCLTHRPAAQIETIVLHEVEPSVLQVFHVQCQEVGLRVAQGDFHLAHLQHLVGMGRTHAQALSAVHDILAQAQGQVHRPFFGFLVADGVIVDAAGHTADDGIES